MLTNLKQWKKIILSLPDDDFFDIMRNYLGELKTPFNKHILIEQLLAFLSRDSTVSRIISLINRGDAYILTLIYSLGGPTTKVLFNFVKASQSFLEFQNHLLNLEERLLIYEESGTGKILISPIFREILEQRVFDTRIVFPSKKIPVHKALPPWFSEALLIAVLSFFKNSPDLFKLDGGLKKRSLEDLSTTFPLLFVTAEGASRFEILFSSLQKLHLIAEESGRVHIHYENLLRFSRLPILNRYTLFFAAAAVDTDSLEDISELGDLLSVFLASLPEAEGFTLSTLLSFLRFYSQDKNISDSRMHRIIETLTMTGILFIYNKQYYALNPFFSENLHLSTDEPVIIIQPSFIITSKPWITLETGLPLALSADIKRYDIFAEYEINKQSCIKIRRIGMTYKNFLDYLEKMSNSSIPQNIRTSVEHWSQDYNTFQLFDGVALVVSSPRQVVIDHLENLKPFILSNPAPGVYIFNKEDEKEWSKLLLDAGFPVLAESAGVSDFELEAVSYEKLQKTGKHFPEINFIEQKQLPQKSSPSFVKDLKKTMDKQNFSRAEYEDISARIERKLILFPGQLQRALKSRDKAEVGGLDYTGKVRLIQRALDSNRNILEIKSTALPGDSSRILIKPVTINHQEENLVLLAQTLPEEDDIEIPIRKISYVKLLRSSLYAPVSG